MFTKRSGDLRRSSERGTAPWSRALRSRFTRLGAATAALAVVLTGATVPAANAVQYEVGDFVSEGALAAGKFLDARRMAVSPVNADVYVTDVTNDKVFRLNNKGTLLGVKGGLGTGEAQFDNPTGVTVDSDGYVYVADRSNHRIQKFTSGLSFEKLWGTK